MDYSYSQGVNYGYNQGVNYDRAPISEVEIGIFIGVVIMVTLYLVYIWYYGLSEEEIAECGDIMQNFHLDPNHKDFTTVWNLRQKLIRQTGRPIKFWLYGVYTVHPDYFDGAKKSEIGLWTRDVERGITLARTRPTSELLDCIWSLYFATGDTQYSDIIKASCDYDVTVIRDAARMSYRSVMKVEWNE